MKKQFLSLLLALCMVIAVLPASHAYGPESGTCGANLTWDLTTDGVVTIRGTGPMEDFTVEDYMGPDMGYQTVFGAGPWIQGTGIDTKTVTIEPGVTSIGSCAFKGCIAMTSISIPDTVTEIGIHAFDDCRSLTNVYIPYGVPAIKEMAFTGCSSLINLDIPSSVREIEDNAFWDCSGLTSVNLPEGLEEIGTGAFMGCSSLANVTIPSTVSVMAWGAFCECAFSSIEIPDKVTVISTSAFQDCKNLTSVTIPNSVRTIEASAFIRCNALSDVYYDGSKEQWEAIEIGNNNQSLQNAKIHFSVQSPESEEDDEVAQPAPEYTPPMNNEEPRSYEFTDVPATSPFAVAIDWAVNQGITIGKTSTIFAPSEQCTHAQILTFLWRGYGEPEPSIYNPFTNVSSDKYYYQAALWAYEHGLVSGTSFEGDMPCSRASAVSYMWKTAGSPEEYWNDTPAFTDVPDSVSYAEAVKWAVSNGITTGTSSTTFDPATICTRGQIVTFLYRGQI